MIVARQLWRRKSLFHGFRFIHSSAACSPAPASSHFRRILGFGAPSCVIKRHDQLSLCYLFRACSLTTHVAVEYPVGGIVDVPLAQTGEGIAECELIKWFVQEGDLVEEFQPLCEVQSDKATIEITSRYKGKITSILHTPGEIVKVFHIVETEFLTMQTLKWVILLYILSFKGTQVRYFDLRKN
ncbi:hypothetical protein KSS87_020719 [Heliosperma pusillum]|nr:hypothetical protein KSS87_020719 [Heliosperma pusillum]